VGERYASLGASGLPVARGVVRWFDVRAGSGLIARDDGEDVFFNFTIPGGVIALFKLVRR